MKFEQSIDISAAPATVFSVYQKVSEWPEWDPEVEAASLEGNFAPGAVGKIKPKGAPESTIQLIEVNQDHAFTVECKLPLCKMHFIHRMDAIDSGTRLINQVAFSGLLSPLFSRLIGKGINKGLPDSLKGIKQYIEKQAG